MGAGADLAKDRAEARRARGPQPSGWKYPKAAFSAVLRAQSAEREASRALRHLDREASWRSSAVDPVVLAHSEDLIRWAHRERVYYAAAVWLLTWINAPERKGRKR